MTDGRFMWFGSEMAAFFPTVRFPTILERAIPMAPPMAAAPPPPGTADLEAKTPAERVAFWLKHYSRCIRCYACKNACPLCYCPTCFVDEAKPQWVGKGQDPTDVRTFHFLRAFHCAGRCTDCGACERACPVGINMRVFTKKLEKDSFEQFGWEAGLNLDERPPLDTYRPNDPDDFIR